MKMKIMSRNFDFKKAYSEQEKQINKIHETLYKSEDRTGKTWLKWPVNYDANEFKKMHQLADKINKSKSKLLVIGVGGSYLGAKCGIDMLAKDSSKVIFCGIDFDYTDLKEKLDSLKDENVYVNVVSKSGTTVETLSTFHLVEKFLKAKYKEKYLSHLIFTTDLNKGYLRKLATELNVETLIVPDDMGGRYSVLSAVGMFPFVVAGINIESIIKGSLDAYKKLSSKNNDAIKYALYRYYMYTKNKKDLELITTFDYKLRFVPSWAQQLFCESEGKENKGMFVSPLYFSRDLHSIGQFIQQGHNSFVETLLHVENKTINAKISGIRKDSPIKFLEGKSFNDLNDAAFNGTIKAHKDREVDIVVISIDKVDEYNFGYLIYFYELAASYSAYLLKVNPFDQPGVEQYKAYMKKILN